MTSAIEREVKLSAWAGFELPDLDGVVPGARAELLEPLRLSATYYDTPDLRLARWGVTVRHRSSVPVTDEHPWTVKLPAGDEGDGSISRRELGFAGPETRVPQEAVSLVRGLARRVALVPVARLRTDRRRWEIRDVDGEALAEVADDEVSVLVGGAGGRGRRLAARFREVEVELAGGDAAVLAALVERLRAAGAGAPDPTPKVVHALGPRAVDPPDVVAGPVGRRSTAAAVVQASVASSVARLFRHDPGVRLGGDIEDVHQARVATRRLRSDLRTFSPLLDPAWTRALRDELGWIAGLLGAVRDADVLLERLHGHVLHLPKGDVDAAETLLAGLDRQQRAASAVLREAMDSPRYVELLDRLVEAAAHPQFAGREVAPGTPPPPLPAAPDVGAVIPAPPEGAVTPAPPEGAVTPAPPEPRDGFAPWQLGADPAVVVAPVAPVAPAAVVAPVPPAAVDAPPRPAAESADAGPADEPAATVLPALARRPWRHLERAMTAMGPEPEDELLHAARIDAKRCRYAAEAVAPAIGREASRLAAAVAELQGVLGDLHDAVVAEAWLREAAAGAPSDQALAAGQLIAMERVDAAACRRAWRSVWKQASGRKLRVWLNP